MEVITLADNLACVFHCIMGYVRVTVRAMYSFEEHAAESYTLLKCFISFDSLLRLLLFFCYYYFSNCNRLSVMSRYFTSQIKLMNSIVCHLLQIDFYVNQSKVDWYT